MKQYDSHIIRRYLTKQLLEKEIHVIANNQEEYIAFDISSFRFIDSLQFLGCNVDTLLGNLSRADTSKFNLIRQFYRNSDEKLEILTQSVPIHTNSLRIKRR